jgi:hypothetical protein
MTVSFLTSRIPRRAAKRRLAVSPVAPVASGYECSLRPCEARISRPLDALCAEGDL